MRVMLRFSVATEPGNKMIKDGEVGKVLPAMLEAMKPEAAYWYGDHGMRAGLFVFTAAESSDITRFSETLWMAGCTSVEVFPVMNQEELMKGLAAAAP